MLLIQLRCFFRARKELKAFLSLPQKNRKIVFYSEDAHSMMHFDELIRVLVQNRKEQICYLTSDFNDPIFDRSDKMISSFYIGEGLVRTTAFYKMKADLLIMTMPDLETFQIKRSKSYSVHYLYIFHAMVSTHSNYRKGAFDNYDTIFCTGPHQIDEIRETERVYNLNPKNLYEDGYRRIEALIKDAKIHRTENTNTLDPEIKTIIVAPSWGENAILEVCGEELVTHLLKAGYRVIVRPHPMTSKHNPQLIEFLSKRFKSNKRFNLEIDIRDKKTLYESHLMICDWSGVAIEYAFACERPVIYINVPKKCNNPEADRIRIEPIEVSIRNKIGEIIQPTDISNIGNIIENLHSNKSVFLEKIRTARSNSIFNLGKSTDNAVDELIKIANNAQQLNEQK